ncbi:uncharacterized protein LOC131854543 [Achroia grisella]|uniref:uncharacterized protein LOC131854543 n=1 Tax=Achroia grisella TaxID=688607 RepID=UPI0027D336E4|nr:uncharacterized protein LOC131854543 [Achroia grisella]
MEMDKKQKNDEVSEKDVVKRVSEKDVEMAEKVVKEVMARECIVVLDRKVSEETGPRGLGNTDVELWSMSGAEVTDQRVARRTRSKVARGIDCGSSRSSSRATTMDEMEFEDAAPSGRKRRLSEYDSDSSAANTSRSSKKEGKKRSAGAKSRISAAKRKELDSFRYEFFEGGKSAMNPDVTVEDVPPKTPQEDGNTAANEAIDRVRLAVYEHTEAIAELIRKSGNLKGTSIRDMKEGLAGINRIIGALSADVVPRSVAPILARNLRLEREVEELRKEVAELRAAKAAPAKATPGGGPSLDDLKSFRAQIMRDVGGTVRSMMGNLMGQFMEEVNTRLPKPSPSSADQLAQAEQGAAVSQPVAPSEEDRGPAPQSQKAAKGKKARKSAPQGQPPAVEPPTIPATQPAAGCSSWATVVRGSRGKMATVPGQEAVADPQPAKKKVNSTPPKKTGPPLPSRLKPPRSAAVVITIGEAAEKEGVSYANILREAKGKIDLRPLGIEDMRLRPAITGGRILEISGTACAEKADALASKLRALIPEDVAKVSRPSKTAEMRIMGLDDSVTPEEIAAAIARDGECNAEDVRVGEIRRSSPSSLGSCWVRGPVMGVKKVTTKGHIRLGWVTAKAELLRQRPLRCFRCLQSGHVRGQCTQKEDRSGLCYRCGENGHKAAVCTAAPRCVVCASQGRPADHWVGSNKCTPPKRKGGKRPASQVPGRRSGAEEGMDTSPPSDQAGRAAQAAPRSLPGRARCLARDRSSCGARCWNLFQLACSPGRPGRRSNFGRKGTNLWAPAAPKAY